MDFISPLAKLADTVIDNLFETDEEKAAAKVKIMQAEQTGRLEEAKISMSAIMAEAQSSDPWTSRARPTFLYVMYAVIGLCFVGGILSVWWPSQVLTAADGVKAMLLAIPDALWALFGAGYLGYNAARSMDKKTIQGARDKIMRR